MLKEYTVILNGQEQTLLLSEEDGQLRGAVLVQPKVKQAPVPANKMRTPRNK